MQTTTTDTSLFVEIPETTLRGSEVIVAPFLVSRYLACKDDTGAAYISATEKPTTRINFYDSREACHQAGFELITNLQYLAIAQLIAETSENWTGGAVGEGSLRQGLRKGSVLAAQANDYEPSDPDERRWFVLPSGERIYDVAGHLFSWVVADIEGDPKTGLVNKPFIAGSPSIATAPYPRLEKGMGWYPKAGADGSGGALIRGGCFYSLEYAGVFCLVVVWPDLECANVGFRCTKPR
ncbi:hypothetical protein [Paracandidimonas soli]|uniref:Sulfatase-modifying factor enzyme 1 n=1 Tax=Paracandidimonas soli TaxID=1917182 RepID=A0A4R3UTC3_9BURK|nr:hypothetical protein [Paracandidimonas soli]TCU93923.1 hypothetical protein EV686_11091 [Paracandidimonas soli]